MDIVTFSGIRKELLLYLDDGPRSLSDIRDRFDITSPEVSPRIKELLENDLIKFEDRKYVMTPMGKTIVNSFRPFMDTVDVFDQNRDWWGEHDLSSIPEEMLNRIGEIKNYFIIEDDPSDMDRTREEFFNIVKGSKNVVGVSCIYVDTLPEFCINAIRNNTSISIVITNQIYDTIKHDYPELLREFIENKNAELFVVDNSIKVSQIVTDKCLYITFNINIGKFDMYSNLVSNDPSSIKWGRDLYEYYRKRSIKVQ
jgi:predicted transcriptional regulator